MQRRLVLNAAASPIGHWYYRKFELKRVTSSPFLRACLPPTTHPPVQFKCRGVLFEPPKKSETTRVCVTLLTIKQELPAAGPCMLYTVWADPPGPRSCPCIKTHMHLPGAYGMLWCIVPRSPIQARCPNRNLPYVPSLALHAGLQEG